MTNPSSPSVRDNETNGPAGAPPGTVPVDNQPGHHPEKEQDKPDLDAYAARLGIKPEVPSPDDSSSDRSSSDRETAPSTAPSGRSRRLIAIAAAGVVGALVALVVVRRRRAR